MRETQTTVRSKSDQTSGDKKVVKSGDGDDADADGGGGDNADFDDGDDGGQVLRPAVHQGCPARVCCCRGSH